MTAARAVFAAAGAPAGVAAPRSSHRKLWLVTVVVAAGVVVTVALVRHFANSSPKCAMGISCLPGGRAAPPGR